MLVWGSGQQMGDAWAARQEVRVTWPCYRLLGEREQERGVCRSLVTRNISRISQMLHFLLWKPGINAEDIWEPEVEGHTGEGGPDTRGCPATLDYTSSLISSPVAWRWAGEVTEARGLGDLPIVTVKGEEAVGPVPSRPTSQPTELHAQHLHFASRSKGSGPLHPWPSPMPSVAHPATVPPWTAFKKWVSTGQVQSVTYNNPL